MLICVYYPFSDERGLFPERSRLVQSRFLKIYEREPFHKNLGPITLRPLGGFPGWIGESFICQIRRSIGVEILSSRESVPLRMAFKRFYFDGFHSGYFSIGISSPSHHFFSRLSPLNFIDFIKQLGTVAVHSPHRKGRTYSLETYSDLAVDLYASGSLRGLKDISDESYRQFVHSGQPLIIISAELSERHSLESLIRAFSPSVQCSVQGKYTLSRYVEWNPRTLMLAMCSFSPKAAAESRFLRTGLARLYLQVFSLERMIKLTQADISVYDQEGMAIIRASINRSLRRLQGADRSTLAKERQSYDYLIEIFSRVFRPGYVTDLENIIERLCARPNLRSALRRSHLVRQSDAAQALGGITVMEITMGNKDVQSGGVRISGNADTGGGDIVGRDKVSNVSLREEVSRAIDPIAAIIGDADEESAKQARRYLQELKIEAEKGNNADDGVMAKLLEGLVGLVPSAIGAVTSAFGTPILGSIAGPVTKYVLDKMKSK